MVTRSEKQEYVGSSLSHSKPNFLMFAKVKGRPEGLPLGFFRNDATFQFFSTELPLDFKQEQSVLRALEGHIVFSAQCD